MKLLGALLHLSMRRLLGWEMMWSSTFGLMALIVGTLRVLSGYQLAG